MRQHMLGETWAAIAKAGACNCLPVCHPQTHEFADECVSAAERGAFWRYEASSHTRSGKDRRMGSSDGRSCARSTTMITAKSAKIVFLLRKYNHRDVWLSKSNLLQYAHSVLRLRSRGMEHVIQHNHIRILADARKHIFPIFERTYADLFHIFDEMIFKCALIKRIVFYNKDIDISVAVHDAIF